MVNKIKPQLQQVHRLSNYIGPMSARPPVYLITTYFPSLSTQFLDDDNININININEININIY